MNHSFICESAHIEELDPTFEGLPIVRGREERELNCVLSNSFGFGGTNATLAFTKLAA
jgi:3-oxoacyl-[acyl-carrier-protein] synthase-1